MTHSRTRRLSALTLTVAITALCVAACGSSSSTGSSSAAASASSSSSASKSGGGSFNRSKFEACLKSHGVTLPARPAGAGGGEGGGAGGGAPGSGSGTRPRGGFFFGGGGGAGAGRFANNPKLRAALQACGGGRGFTGRRFTLSHAAVTKFVACVKAHGYNLPAPNFSGKGGVFPRNIESNKKFQAAAKACASDLRPAGAPGPGGAGAPPPGGGGSSTSTT
jgi:hypothetical protein